MPEKTVLYFDRKGPDNTEAVARAVRQKVEELGVSHVAVASNSGATALRFHETLQGSGVTLVSVTEHCGFSGGDQVFLTPEARAELEAKGIKVLMCSHALSGVARSISSKFGGVTPVEIIAHTLRRLGDGIKVAVEVSVMAADAGLVPTDREIIAAGGSGKGADAAIVLKAAHMNNFFDLEIREIIAMVRHRA